MHKFGIVIGSLCLFAAVQPHLPPHENTLTCSLHLGVWTLTSVSQKTNNTVFTYGKIHVIVIPCVVNKNLHSLPCRYLCQIFCYSGSCCHMPTHVLYNKTAANHSASTNEATWCVMTLLLLQSLQCIPCHCLLSITYSRLVESWFIHTRLVQSLISGYV